MVNWGFLNKPVFSLTLKLVRKPVRTTYYGLVMLFFSFSFCLENLSLYNYINCLVFSSSLLSKMGQCGDKNAMNVESFFSIWKLEVYPRSVPFLLVNIDKEMKINVCFSICFKTLINEVTIS